MAGLRKGRCYKNVTRAYTRKSKFQKKNFLRTVPNKKIVRFDMGEEKPFDVQVHLVAKTPHNIRHNAMESARRVIHRELQESVGVNDYHFKVRVFPHHALRENKMLSGAHADRLQTGMAHSFGKIVGLAARVKLGQKVLSARVKKDKVDLAKKALKKARPRLPGKYSIVVEKVAV